MSGFTPTQSRMLELLADGMPHSREELHTCLCDDLGSIDNVRVHICSIRKKLRDVGEDIVSIMVNGRFQYRQVRLLASAYNGRK